MSAQSDTTIYLVVLLCAVTILIRTLPEIEEAAQKNANPALALAYIKAADKAIQVDDFAADTN